MTNDLTNFAFEDHLVRTTTIDGEPWFVGKDVCAAMGIRNSKDALSTLDDDEKGVGTTDPLSAGGAQTVVIVSEPGVYRLVFRSRKPEAERFKRWLAHEVLPQIRKTGQYAPATAQASTDPVPDLTVDAPFAARVNAVRVAMRLHGRERAAVLWNRLGLPAVPPPPPDRGLPEARACLHHLITHRPETGDGREVRQLILDVIDGDENARATLLGVGVSVDAVNDGFIVANRHHALADLFRDTLWWDNGWRMVLRRFTRSQATPPARYTRNMPVTRGVWLPADVLDDGA